MQISDGVAEILELEKNLTVFLKNLSGEPGEKILKSLKPAENFGQLQRREKLLREWLDYTDHNGRLNLNLGLELVSSSFNAAKRSGILSGQELLKVRALLTCAKNLREKLPGLENYKMIDNLCHGIRDFSPELEALSVIEDSGRLADSASPKLLDLRQELENLKRNARRIAQKIFEDTDSANMLQERTLSWREGRFLVLVRQEYINRFPGLAFERSASGNSVYMEPRSLSNINNNLIVKSRDERDEEQRILSEITHKILSRENAIVNAERIIGTFDLLCVCDFLVRDKKWLIPELSNRKFFRLVGAKHPMLSERAVPIDASCGENFTSLVITGPNTGGKTVALKTIGVLVIIAWLGLPISARDGSVIGNFDNIFADIGDEQSIEQNLSTFSSHLRKIIFILKNATDSSLVLLDELGSGTDPQEGAALGIAILETLKESGCLTIANTHHNPIKQYALTTHGVETASVEFDVNNLQPTYKLLMGVPGRSNALLIAKRYGMPEKVLKLAQGSLDEREITSEDIISELNERKAALDIQEKKFYETMREAEDLKQAYQERVAEIDLQRDKIMEAADRRAERVISHAEETSRDMLRELEETARVTARQSLDHRRTQLKRLRGEIDSRRGKRIKREIENAPKPFVVEPGVTAQVAGSNLVGLVEEVKNGKAHMLAGAMHLEVPVEQLIATDKKAKVAIPAASLEDLDKRLTQSESVPPSIMVRGMYVGEAMPLVENYLDRAYRTGHSIVTIIHGRGEGILRREVHALCARLKYVKEFRLGGEGEGGFGVTVVTFKK